MHVQRIDNGHAVEVTGASCIGAMILGPLYFALHGAWGLALAYVAGLLTGFATAGLTAALTHVVFVSWAPAMLLSSYRRRGGWRIVTTPVDSRIPDPLHVAGFVMLTCAAIAAFGWIVFALTPGFDSGY